jgi:hypothetical protein
LSAVAAKAVLLNIRSGKAPFLRLELDRGMTNISHLMKTLRYPALLLGMLVLAAGLCAKDFEGMIRLKMTSPDKPAKSSNGDGPMFMNYYMKGGLFRIDMELGNGKAAESIIDPVKREMIMVMPEQRMYMVMKMPEPQKPAATATATPPSDVEFVRTGETDRILGYKCEKIIVKTKNGEAEIWGAEGLGVFQGMSRGGPMGRPAQKSAWETALGEHGFFPLRMVSRDKSGKEQMRMEAVAIDPKSLPDSLFAPPADFQKLEMPSFGGMNPFGNKGN